MTAPRGEKLPIPSMEPQPIPMSSSDRSRRDFLLHLEDYLARRDGVDKLLKIARYSAKIAVAASSSSTVAPRLKSFESSVGLSRKAFRLGKFIQDVNALRASTAAPAHVIALSIVAYAGEGLYYFIEQLVWLSKTGLIPSHSTPRLQKISAWAELLGYFGSVALKLQELRQIQVRLESTNPCDAVEIRKLMAKRLLKRLSVVQDISDALMALGDVRDGKGFLSGPLLMSSAGLLSALISTHKNWNSC